LLKSIKDDIQDDILPFLLNDTLLFVTQKTEWGACSPSCFGDSTTKGSNDGPSVEMTILYDRLWEAFRIYPEEWIRILNFACLDGPFKGKFNEWLACHDFESVSFNNFEVLFGETLGIYGIDWVLRHIRQRLQELKRNLIHADLGIKITRSLRMSC
jgi:hypothetical protein